MDTTKAQGPIVSKAIKDGVIKGLRTALMLLTIMIPIYLGVTLLRHTAFFAWLADRIAPAMNVFALPGEAVIPVIAGFFADEYAVVAAMSGFSFTAAQITIIAIVILALHSMPVETVITRRIGMPALRIALFRVGLAVISGLIVAYLAALFLGGDLPGAVTGNGLLRAENALAMTGSGVFDAGWDVILPEMGWGAVQTVINLLRVLIPLMICIELMLAYKVIEALANKMGFFCRILNIGKDALLPLLVGLFLGVTYGAGALAEMNRIRPLPPRDMALLGVFLFSCHGIIETTYLFAIAGANAIFVSVVRLAIAIGITAAAGRLIKRQESNKRNKSTNAT